MATAGAPPRAAGAAAIRQRNLGVHLLIGVLVAVFALHEYLKVCAHPLNGGGGARGIVRRAADARMLAAGDAPPRLVLLSNAVGDTITVRVMSYNTMLLPMPAAPDPYARAPAQGRALGRALRSGTVDVVALQEVVLPAAAQSLVAEARFGWHAAPLVAEGMLRMNGGVALGARAAPDGTRSLVYKAHATGGGVSWDKLIAKGVVHAWWTLRTSPLRRLHVFNTHAQSPLNEQHVREQQVEELHAFIAGFGMDPAVDIVLICGDMNMELSREEFLRLLRVRTPQWGLATPTHRRATWDSWAPSGPVDLLDCVALHAEYSAGVRRCITNVVDLHGDARSAWHGSLSDHKAVLTTLTIALN